MESSPNTEMAPASLVIALFLVTIFPGRLAALENSRQLAEYCETVDSGVVGRGQEVEIPGTKEAILCWGYMEALQDLSALVDLSGNRILGTCLPEKGTLLDLIHSFVEYARSHRTTLPDNSAVAVITALKQAYPCSATNRAPKPPTRK